MTDRPRWERLDHLRGIAAFMVFAWHFIHVPGAVPYSAAPAVLGLLEEGHTGVALFMVLSGYLFAKIVGDQAIDCRRFLIARLLRLGPLLFLVLVASTAEEAFRAPAEAVRHLVTGRWQWGAWSVAVELQFYLLLPVLLAAARRNVHALIGLVAVAVALRAAIYLSMHTVGDLAYHTLVGRVDQFVIGILAWRLLRGGPVHGGLMAVAAVGFLAAFHLFNAAGGLYGTAASPLWVVFPTLEGAFYALLIAWYDGGRWSLPSPFAFVGKISFSIYLMHYVPLMVLGPRLVRWFDLTNVYVALGAALVAFVVFLPVAWLSWRYLERLPNAPRISYLRAAVPAAGRRSAIAGADEEALAGRS